MGSSPNWSYGFVPTAAQWNAAFASKQDDLGFTPVNRSGDAMLGRFVTFASVPERAGFNLSPGASPTSPVDGDVWVTATGIFAHVNGVTVGPIGPGSVTSVGLSAPAQFIVTDSPVTSAGSLTLSWATQAANRLFAGPSSGGDAPPTFRSLVGADLPNPSASSLGGTRSQTAVASQFMTGISTSGIPTLAQPAFTDVSGIAAVAQGGTGSSTPSGARNNLGLGSLATKSTIAVPSDITATGTPSSSTVLFGDGSWRIPSPTSYAVKSGNYTALPSDNGATNRYTASATVTLTAAATLGSSWTYTVLADGGIVVIDPNGSETINGQLTLTVPNGATASIVCDGSNFFMIIVPEVWQTIEDVTLSAVANYSNTNLSPFRKTRISGSLFPSSATGFYAQLSVSGVFATGASDYTTQYIGAQGSGAGQALITSSSMALTNSASVDNNADAAITFNIMFERFNKANRTRGIGQSGWITGTPTTNQYTCDRTASVINDGIRIIPGTGTMSGYITLEGVRG